MVYFKKRNLIRKWRLVLLCILIFLGFLVIFFATDRKSVSDIITGRAVALCYDSDGGLNYFMPGYINYAGIQQFDYCKSSTLFEMYCPHPTLMDYKVTKCPYGCKDGACIAGCFDTDSGKNYYEKGTVTVGSESRTDYCTDCKDVCFELAPCPFECKSLEEFYCQEGEIKSINVPCKNGCKDGKCKESVEQVNYQDVLNMLNGCHVESMLADRYVYNQYTGSIQCGNHFTCIASYFSEVSNPKSQNFSLANTVRASCNEVFKGKTTWYYIQSVCCNPYTG